MTRYRPSVTQLHLQLSCNNSPDKHDIVAMTILSWCIVLHYCLPVQYDIDDMASPVAATLEVGVGGTPVKELVGKWVCTCQITWAKSLLCAMLEA